MVCTASHSGEKNPNRNPEKNITNTAQCPESTTVAQEWSQ